MKRLQDRDISPAAKRYRSPPARRDVHSRDRTPDRDQREGRASKRDSGRDFDHKAHRDSDYDDRSRKRFKDERNTQGRYPNPVQTERSEFRSICVSGFPSQLPDHEVKDALYYQFKKFGEFSVKVTYNAQDKRLCYVNFRYPEDARAAKDHKGKLFMFDRPVRVDAVFPNFKSQQRPQFKPRSSSPSDFGKDRDRRDTDTFSNRSGSPVGERRRNDSIGSDNRENRRGEPRFPYHLNHISPEDDDKATRTLFVGNLDFDVGLTELRQVFVKYGFVEDIDIKMAPGGRGNPFAFVRYHNLDMAHRAKVEMSGQYIGKFQCKIGYGKVNPTTCLWIGGLGPWIRIETLEREFDRFGVIHKIVWPQDKNYAYVLYDNTEAALAACQEMRGFPLGGTNRRLRVDFGDPGQISGDQPSSTSPDPPPGPSGDADDFGEAARVSRGEIPSNSKWHGNPDRPPRTKEWHDREPNSYKNQNNYNDFNQRRGGRDSNSAPDGRGDNRYQQGKSRTPPSDHFIKDKDPRYDNGNHSPSAKRTRYNQGADINDKRTGDHSSGPRTCSPDTLRKVENISDLSKCLPSVWNGVFALKNSSFSTRLHLVSGDRAIVDSLMRESQTLRITQRLRLDQTKLDEVAKRVQTVGPSGHCVLLAMPGDTLTSDDPKVQQRLLKNLVTYLKQKEAAGVVSLTPPGGAKDSDNTGVLHAFPPCEFGHENLARYAPNLTFDSSKDDHLLVIAVKGGI